MSGNDKDTIKISEIVNDIKQQINAQLKKDPNDFIPEKDIEQFAAAAVAALEWMVNGQKCTISDTEKYSGVIKDLASKVISGLKDGTKNRKDRLKYLLHDVLLKDLTDVVKEVICKKQGTPGVVQQRATEIAAKPEYTTKEFAQLVAEQIKAIAESNTSPSKGKINCLNLAAENITQAVNALAVDEELRVDKFKADAADVDKLVQTVISRAQNDSLETSFDKQQQIVADFLEVVDEKEIAHDASDNTVSIELEVRNRLSAQCKIDENAKVSGKQIRKLLLKFTSDSAGFAHRLEKEKNVDSKTASSVTADVKQQITDVLSINALQGVEIKETQLRDIAEHILEYVAANHRTINRSATPIIDGTIDIGAIAAASIVQFAPEGKREGLKEAFVGNISQKLQKMGDKQDKDDIRNTVAKQFETLPVAREGISRGKDSPEKGNVVKRLAMRNPKVTLLGAVLGLFVGIKKLFFGKKVDEKGEEKKPSWVSKVAGAALTAVAAYGGYHAIKAMRNNGREGGMSR